MQKNVEKVPLIFKDFNDIKTALFTIPTHYITPLLLYVFDQFRPSGNQCQKRGLELIVRAIARQIETRVRFSAWPFDFQYYFPDEKGRVNIECCHKICIGIYMCIFNYRYGLIKFKSDFYIMKIIITIKTLKFIIYR